MKFLIFIIVLSLSLFNCAMVPQMEREYLSDPVMLLSEDPIEGVLDGHNFPRREGSVGGSAGAGGGCGC
jgi:hypothetical protein